MRMLAETGKRESLSTVCPDTNRKATQEEEATALNHKNKPENTIPSVCRQPGTGTLTELSELGQFYRKNVFEKVV